MKYVKLGDVCEFINGDRGKNYPSSKDFVDKGIPFINAGHIQNNDISFENMNYISKEKFNKLGSGKVKKNDILYCLRGSLGKNAIVNIEEGAIASSLVILRSKTEDIDVNYLIKYLNSNYIKEQILKYNNGSSQPNLSAASVKNFNIYIPNNEKQKEISRILDKAQQLIDKRKEQIEALDELVKSKFIEMFGDPVSNPKGFKVKNLSEIAESFIGLTYKPDDVSDNGTLVLRSGNIQNSKLVFSDNVRVTTNVREKLFVKENDILMCSRNGSARLVGKVAMIPKLDEEITFGAFMTIIRSKNYSYLFTYFQLEAFRQQLQSAKTTTINQITKKMLDEIKIPLPPIELQNQFADFVKQVDKLKFEMEKSLKELEDNFNSLMQKAFKGELFD